MNKQGPLGAIASIVALAVIVLMLCGCSEDITITFLEDEQWAAEAYYSGACDSGANSSNCLRMERVIKEVGRLGISGYRRGETVIFEGQGYDLLEEMLDRSQCCESAVIELRSDAGEHWIYFSLKEKDNAFQGRDEWDWTITLVGSEVISSSGFNPGETLGQTQWTVSRSSWSSEENRLRNRPKKEMVALLREKGPDPIPTGPAIIPPIVLGTGIFVTMILIVVSLLTRRRKAVWVFSILFCALICTLALIIIPVSDSVPDSVPDCDYQCVNYDLRIGSSLDRVCVEYAYIESPNCKVPPNSADRQPAKENDASE